MVDKETPITSSRPLTQSAPPFANFTQLNSAIKAPLWIPLVCLIAFPLSIPHRPFEAFPFSDDELNRIGVLGEGESLRLLLQ